MIHRRYRNWIKSINNQINANTFAPMQHKSIIINLHITLKADYSKLLNRDNCPYDLQKARAEPMLIQHEVENANLEGTPIDDIWNKTHNKLLTTLIKNSPKTKKPKQNKVLNTSPIARSSKIITISLDSLRKGLKSSKTNYYLKHGKAGRDNYRNQATTVIHTTGKKTSNTHKNGQTELLKTLNYIRNWRMINANRMMIKS